jgi:hypothetical protein
MTHALDFAGVRFDDAAMEVSSVLVSGATTEDFLSCLFSASALVARSSPDSVGCVETTDALLLKSLDVLRKHPFRVPII